MADLAAQANIPVTPKRSILKKRYILLGALLHAVAENKGGGSLSSLAQLNTSINFSLVPRLLPPHAIIPRGFRFRAGQRSYVAWE